MSEEEKNNQESHINILEAYGNDEDEQKYALKEIEDINDELTERERQTTVFNGVSYSKAYEYNQKKAMNYAPPKQNSTDKQVSTGMIHEKIVSFAAIFLKYVFKRQVKCYDKKGNLIRGLGDVYDLGIEFSHKLEDFKKKIALIYWEVFTQGNCFILEDWEVKNKEIPKAKKKGTDEEIDRENMDYTYEFLENLKYEEGEKIQERKAVSRVLDGRMVIFGNPEIEDVQEQPAITIEERMPRKEAEQMFGSLKRWKYVPTQREDITDGLGEKVTLFNHSRLQDPSKEVIVHRRFKKHENKFNIFVNGVMMLPRETPMTVFYPRGNYPLTNIPAEQLTGSIYCRSIPAKTKFNADFMDWALKHIAIKFEQGIHPPILAKGKYTLTRDIFDAGQVTHGVTKDDYEKADPENAGLQNSEFSFMQYLRDILETQTANPTTSGEITSGSTATEISIAEQNQRDKLGYLLDGLMYGFMDMYMRRAETIENKYTLKQDEVDVNGEKRKIYQNFTVNMSGEENKVTFDEAVGKPDFDQEQEQEELHRLSQKSKEAGKPTNFYKVNPHELRKGKFIIDIEIRTERVKETQLQMQAMWEEFSNLLNTFGSQVNVDSLKKEYLEVSGRPSEIFKDQQSQMLEELQQATQQRQQGGQGPQQGGQGQQGSSSQQKGAMTKTR